MDNTNNICNHSRNENMATRGTNNTNTHTHGKANLTTMTLSAATIKSFAHNERM